MRINRFSEEMIKRFGEKVYRIPLSAGCTCPNRDGTLGTGGCAFCSGSGSGEFSFPDIPISEQIRKGKELLAGKTDARRFIGYFQSYTNTYGDQNRLRQLFLEVISDPEICALSIATRPDCLEEDMISFLSDLSGIKPVWVELGLQTANDETARAMNRCYEREAFDSAYKRLKKAGLEVIVHIILGLPGEDEEDMMRTARYVSQLKPEVNGIKIHMLQILKGTALGEEYEREPFRVLSLEEYTDLVIRIFRMLPESTVIHRFTGDGPKKLLIEPKWCWEKKKVLNYMNKEIARA
ncbi:MAG: TIGR01212 family radical SAM protein [Oscillospiraceae bacterium]|nr:TIGR01212 family radical SAM protein [Oscillospiraceae bacterium]